MNIPKDELRQGRQVAFKRIKKRNARKHVGMSIATVCILCLCFVVGVKQSTYIATTASKIPGLSSIVEALEKEGNMHHLISNAYYEQLNIVEQTEDVTISLKGAIIDEYNLLIYFDLDFTHENHEQLSNINLYQGNQLLESSMSFGFNPQDEVNTNIHEEHTIDMPLTTPLDLQRKDFTLSFEIGSNSYTIPFQLQNDIAAAKITKSNKVVEFEGQQLVIKEIRRSPLRVAIDIETPESNSMNIFHLVNMTLILPDGTKSKSGSNGGMLSIGGENNRTTYLFDSNYYSDTDQMILLLDKVYGIPKAESYIEVDWATKEILHKPDYYDWKISFGVDEEYGEQYISIIPTEEMYRPLLGRPITTDGVEIETSFLMQHHMQHSEFRGVISDNIEGIVRFPITFYNNLLIEDKKVFLSIE